MVFRLLPCLCKQAASFNVLGRQLLPIGDLSMALPRTPALATDCVVFDPLAYCSFAAGMNPEAFPWTWAPAYLVRDNDRAYGHAFTSRLRAMGIRPISPGSQWQNGCAERLIGTHCAASAWIKW